MAAPGALPEPEAEPWPERPVSGANKSGLPEAEPWPERPVSGANKSGLPEAEPWPARRSAALASGHRAPRGAPPILGPSGLQGGMHVRISVDADKCQGHNRCYSLAPELFDVDDYGYATAAGDGEVPAGMEDKARLAAANCPEYAVLIEE